MKSLAYRAMLLSAFLAVTILTQAQTKVAAPPPRHRAELAFVANQSGDDLSAYQIKPSGALLAVPGSPFAVGSSANSVTVVPSGRFVYVADVIPGGVSAFSVAQNGALTPVPGSPFATTDGTAFVTTDPSGRFLYALNCGDNCSGSGPGYIAAYNIDQQTGSLTPVIGSPFTTGQFPYSLAIDPTGHFAYAANAGSNNVYSYAIDSQSGALSQIGLPIAAGTRPLSIAVDPWGQFVYSANTGSSDVSAFAINFDGSLRKVIGSPFPAGAFTAGIAASHAGKFVVVSAGPGAYVYLIDAIGALHLLADSPVGAGLGPNGVSIDPNDGLVYIVNAGSANVSAYKFNNQSGKLTPVVGSPFPAGAFAAGVTTAPAPTHE